MGTQLGRRRLFVLPLARGLDLDDRGELLGARVVCGCRVGAPLKSTTITVSFIAFLPLPILIVLTCTDWTVTSDGGVGAGVGVGLGVGDGELTTEVVACGDVGAG